jgi:hypothetical protein
MKNIFLKTIGGTALIAMLVGASLAWSDPGKNQPPTIEGVWQVTRQGVNCNDPSQAVGSPFPALMAFHRDGIVTGAAKSPVTGPFDTPQYGTWQRKPGGQNYSFRALSYRYDNNGAFTGSIILTAQVELTDGDSFVYSATIEITNADGDLLVSNCGRGTGKRFE